MKYFLSAFIMLLTGAVSVQAYSPTVTEIDRPYDVTVIGPELELTQDYLGELNDFPVMYEMVSTDSFDLNVVMAQRHYSGQDPLPLALIAVRQNEDGSGVTEVARLNLESADWVYKKDSVMGMAFWISPSLNETVASGTYRVEISTPNNQGKYLITFGEVEESTGYFSTVGAVWTTQKFFDHSVFSLLLSSYVYYPLGITLLLFGFYKTWRYRKLLSHVD